MEVAFLFCVGEGVRLAVGEIVLAGEAVAVAVRVKAVEVLVPV